jgi:hypothetical protein
LTATATICAAYTGLAQYIGGSAIGERGVIIINDIFSISCEIVACDEICGRVLSHITGDFI